MNTEKLINEQTEFYRDFFDEYDLVISSPIHFPIIGDTAIYSQGNSSILIQKLTLRNYIGINFTKTNGKHKIIYKKNGKFEETLIENCYPLDNDTFNDIGLNYDIGFLSEYNWNDPPSIIANIIVSKLIIDNQISLEDISKLDISNPNHMEIIDKVIKLDKELLSKHNLFSNIRNNSTFILGSLIKSKSHLLILEKGEKLQIKDIGLKESFKQVDMCVSFINSNSVTQNNYNPKILKEKNNEIVKYISKSDIIKDKNDINLINGIETISNHYAIKAHKNLHKMYNGHGPSTFFNDLFSYRQVIRSIFSDFNSQKIDVRQLKNHFINNIGDKNLKIYVDNVGVSGPNRIVIFTNKTGSIDENIINKINKESGLELTLDYSSYYDGYEIDGTKIEQYKSKGIISKLCSGKLVVSYSQQGSSYKTGDLNQLISKEKKGLILDKISKKIYLNGEKLTSKDIHSQSFTIDMLEILIENIGKEVDNKQLPLSAYSKNKNEMLGKIILPLKKLIENKTGITLPIECRGSLGEFCTKLEQNNLNIKIINK